MSRSRGSSLFGCDRTSVAQVRRDAYDETEHYEIAEIHHCQPFRTLEFRYDGDYMKDTDIARPDFGPRSGSIDVQHGIPYVREEYLEKPRLSCSPQNEFRHCVVEESYEAETHDDLAIRRPTRSVHVLRSHGNTEDLLEREKGNEHERGVIRRRRGSFDGDRAQGHRLLDRYSVEPVKEPRVRFRRRELYDREGQNSHDHVYQAPYRERSQRYNVTQPRQEDRLIAASLEDRESIQGYGWTRNSPTRVYAPGYAPITHRSKEYRSSCYGDDEWHRRNFDEPKGAGFYRDV
ncbi:hypothetical protein MMC19_004422 [Ptychographa xylographoides]|nr:hypothetical protein [Ptychographa xylographoides]